MNRTTQKRIAISLLALGLSTASVASHAESSGSDSAFDHVIGSMAAPDTGSAWFNHYVAVLNQEIAARDTTEAYGAAGPNGPLNAFDSYVGGFSVPDSGSRRFNDYVDAVNQDIRIKYGY